MDNLRWILIFLGVAILVLLYLTGRQQSPSKRQKDALNKSGRQPTGRQAEVDPLMGDQGLGMQQSPDRLNEQEYMSDSVVADNSNPFDSAVEIEMDDPLERPGGQDPSRVKKSSANAGGKSAISSKIEAIGAKLSPKRRERVAASEADSGSNEKRDSYASKIVTLHVVAPEGELMNGAHLLEQFEQRGYHFGDMNIFHSMHEGKTVFSIAKLVMPGTFDINDIDSFQTPGVSLILQLPGPVPADVAFEVLLSEAHELATAMDGTVLDADRSTLSKQTVQHMREGIYEYMHRQKYFNAVPS